MKLVFAHDHLFQLDKNGNLFTGGSYNNQIWERYLNHFDEVTVLARVENLQDQNSNKIYNPFDLKETQLVSVPSLSGPIKQFSNKKKAKEIIRNALMNADVLIARLPSEIGNLAISIAKELNMLYAVEVVACVWDALWNHGELLAKIYAPIAMKKMKERVLDSPYTLYVTGEFLQKRYPTRGKSVSISDVEIYKVYENALELRSRKSNNGPTKIGMIGSLKNGIKGLGVALKAFQLLDRKNIDFQFYILGDGDVKIWENQSQKLGIRSKVNFCGVLPGGEPVLNWLDQMDIYIQPSFQEGLPRAVIEAMSRGCPIVGSNAGGIPELIDNSCIHKTGDYKSLASRIERIIREKDYSLALTKMNLESSKAYKKDKLDKKRNEFWDSFVADGF